MQLRFGGLDVIEEKGAVALAQGDSLLDAPALNDALADRERDIPDEVLARPDVEARDLLELMRGSVEKVTEGAVERSRDWRRAMEISCRKTLAIACSTWFSKAIAYTTTTMSSDGTTYMGSSGRYGVT